ncbi:N-acetylglucosamine-6-phosphate deacetylase [Nesterenkonia haasae]|uniref:N-acetylglucosamine-6-phosphate deacetylase n=1 Tax=Nesterenkonia haasae TaxID=2587813 RepID=UPI001390BFF6|nr:N-acetylglucosamine-6-phosphate deacetylase [Nesterenkonia haasae]NDK31575.1 N-acetylglucosamine-6-phosphate deacetylase [Nesterenkonia haasae]
MDQIIRADAALRPDGSIGPWWVRVSGGVILEAQGGDPPEQADLHVRDGVLSPGFVDVHVHGGGGADFTEGADAGRTVIAAHRAHGTTTMVASLVSAPVDDLLVQTEKLRPLVDSSELAGVHWEGPWLSNEHRGAHDPEVLTAPTVQQISALIGHPAAQLVRYVTLAPELDNGIEATRELTNHGITVGVGHTNASHAVTSQALTAGATAATHLFNGMRPLHHREPGPAVALLHHAEAFLEIIADGVHLHPAVIRHAWASAQARGGSRRIVLVSDAMAAATAHDGDYVLGNLPVRVTRGTARLLTDGGEETSIAGSTLTMEAAMRYCIRKADIPAEDALSAATAHPAAMLGLENVGSLRPGSRADMVLLNSSWKVRRVMRAGQWLTRGLEGTS